MKRTKWYKSTAIIEDYHTGSKMDGLRVKARVELDLRVRTRVRVRTMSKG